MILVTFTVNFGDYLLRRGLVVFPAPFLHPISQTSSWLDAGNAAAANWLTKGKEGIWMTFEEFLASLKAYNETLKAWAINPQREMNLINAYKELVRLVLDEDDDALVHCEFNKLNMGEAVIHIESDWLVVREIENFCKAISSASNMEVRPKGNGIVVVNIMFYGVFDLN